MERLLVDMVNEKAYLLLVNVMWKRPLWYLIALLILILAGCEKMGYLVMIQVDAVMSYDEVMNLESVITENGYQVLVKEIPAEEIFLNQSTPPGKSIFVL